MAQVVARVERAWFSLWLVGPTDLSPRLVLHMERTGDSWVLREHFAVPAYIRVSADESKRITPEVLLGARPLAEALETAPSRTLFDLVHRVALLALRQPIWEVRLGVLWMAIEMLLGPESAGETTRSLGQRAAVLLESAQASRSERAAAVRRLYAQRSRVVHGRLAVSSEDALTKALVGSEALLRDLLLRLFSDPAALRVMSSRDRDAWLEAQVLGGTA